MMQDMHSSGYTGQPDFDFLAMMIPYHEGAMDMTRLVLIQGHDPMVRKIAEEIIASQTVEIASMRGRMAVLRAGPNSEPGGYPALGLNARSGMGGSASTGRFSFGLFGAGLWASSFQASTMSVSGLQPR